VAETPPKPVSFGVGDQFTVKGKGEMAFPPLYYLSLKVNHDIFIISSSKRRLYISLSEKVKGIF
jgi:hypothetical protein